MTGRKRRGTGGGQRFGPRHALILVLVAAFGAALLAAGLDRWHDHRVLASRGLTATAVITGVHRGRGGPSVDVRFTTATGRGIATRVGDADSPDGLREGGTILVRYDPLDAGGRIESARDGNAAITRWFLAISGALLLALAGYGAGWWLWRASRRQQGGRAARWFLTARPRW